MNVLISGGCKNGKSTFARNIALRLAGDGKRYYVATMIPCDDEDRARVARHVADRAGLGFETLELGREVERCLELADPGATFLVDSVTALLLNEMYPGGHSAGVDPDAVDRCAAGLLKVAAGAGNAVFVSDYIYSDAVRYDSFTEKYRADLAYVDKALASVCDVVIEVCAGNVLVHKRAWTP